MSDLLLQTKLFKPALRPSLINRSHLIDRLNGRLNQSAEIFLARLTLVSAPAGFGKTTLVSSWLAGLSAVKTAWLSLDENDNDPVRFLTYLIAALQTAESTLGETAVRLLQSPQPPPAETVLTLVINDISEYGRPLILILDDYHTITTPAIHQALAFLLENQPPSFHLLLTTRSDPPLPLSRLRARSQIIELRANDLRFTLEEAGQFLNRVMELNLSTEALATLEQRTEGWIAGLQLAALSMQGHDDLKGFITAFTGSHRFILDYLTDEVLERRPKGTRDFLLQTSILDRFCAPLCDAVTGNTDSQEILELLEQANLFLIPLDQERNWYRYHHLFADVLRSRVKHRTALTGNELVSQEELHRRASLWFEGEGFIDEAILHALAIPDMDHAATLVEQNSQPMIHRSEVLQLRYWLTQLPPQLIQNRPRLILAQGWVLALTGQSQAAITWLNKPSAITVLNEPNLPAEFQGEMALLRATLTQIQNEGDHGLALAQEALTLLPEHQRGIRAGAIHLIGTALFRQGDTAGASQAFLEAIELGEAEDGPFMALYAVQDLASIQIRQGRLKLIKQTCQKGMKIASRRSGRLLPAAGMAYIDYGGILYEENDLDGATQALNYGIKLLRGSTNPYLLSEGYTFLARIRQASGQQAEALAAIDEGEDWLRQVQVTSPLSWAFLALGRARLWILQGDLNPAVHWADNQAKWSEYNHLNYHQMVTLVRVRLAQSRNQAQKSLLQEAAEIIDQLLIGAKMNEWWGWVMELLLLKALYCQVTGERSVMFASLDKTLSLAEPEGFTRIFVDEGEPMAAMLRQARPQSRYSDYIDALLGAFPGSEAKQKGGDLLPEPLSEREMEVLQLMAGGATNKDIASRLFIAVSTVKKHIGNILVKLDTTNRVEAAARARDLGLLP